MLCPPGHNGMAKYLPAGLSQTPCGLAPPALLYFPKGVHQLGRVNFCNGPGSNLRKNIPFKPCQNLLAVSWCKSFALVVKPFPRNALKCGLAPVQGCAPFGFFCRARVGTLSQ